MDKTALEDDTKLDLTADHVHPLLMSPRDVLEMIDNIEPEAADIMNAALDYMEAEGKDAILVITIKRD